ncbi:recombinase family protein [Flavobacterium tyrosinilyticum]|uniref:recombinase family protein n=1 Tax=Flavobacterium tyrosinilyticum TaxID=1658740 RepID=UPI002030308A|nr:recombinase family protein [Flavobacterium tyrosinilyticum]MCM0666408.1 recombinase family protein [Flavobacterium tyrosinilyticum]
MLAIYCRTSKNKEEGTDYSIETQQQGGIKLASQLGVDYKFYIDEGMSGTLAIEDRPSLADMMSDLKKGIISNIYCIDQSRIERNSAVWNIFSAECTIHECKFYPNGIEFDFSNDESVLGSNLISLVNSYYAKITSRKVKLANYNKTLKGKTHGMKPYGYKRDEDNNFEIFEEEAQYVRKMFKLSLQGIGSYTIANILNAEGAPTKFNKFKGKIKRKNEFTKNIIEFEKSDVKWRGNVIHDMLKNPIYKGIRIWNKDDIEKRIEVKIDVQIIEDDLWNKVNDNLPKNIKNVGKKAEYHYLLNGIITCGHCGNEVLGKKRPKGNDNSYKCKGKRPPHKNCNDSRAISLPKLENFIIHHLFKTKNLKDLLIEAPKSNLSIPLREKLEQKKSELIGLNKQIDRLAKLLIDPELEDDETFINDYKLSKAKRIRINSEIEELQAKVLEVENETRNSRTKTLIETYTDDIQFDEIKRLVHSLIETIIIRHKKEEKSGCYFVVIKYKNYSEESLFMTNYKALDWIWHSYYREKALSEEQLAEDIEDLRAIYEFKGIPFDEEVDLIDYEGANVMTSMLGDDGVQLNPSELILFD